jgi:hypothetical protein
MSAGNWREPHKHLYFLSVNNTLLLLLLWLGFRALVSRPRSHRWLMVEGGDGRAWEDLQAEV